MRGAQIGPGGAAPRRGGERRGLEHVGHLDLRRQVEDLFAGILIGC